MTEPTPEAVAKAQQVMTETFGWTDTNIQNRVLVVAFAGGVQAIAQAITEAVEANTKALTQCSCGENHADYGGLPVLGHCWICQEPALKFGVKSSLPVHPECAVEVERSKDDAELHETVHSLNEKWTALLEAEQAKKMWCPVCLFSAWTPTPSGNECTYCKTLEAFKAERQRGEKLAEAAQALRHWADYCNGESYRGGEMPWDALEDAVKAFDTALAAYQEGAHA